MNPAVRRVDASHNALFLTFDDGPDPNLTPQVLSALASAGAKATFFLVGERALQHPDLVARIREQGHSVGNHSLDHRYGVFFKGRHAMLNWVSQAEEVLNSLDCSPVGFRPPVGVRTPELYWALHELGVPMVLWRRRFFDAVWPWRTGRALASLQRTQAGDIVLLHDRQKPQHRETFLSTLSTYVQAAQEAGFKLEALQADQTGRACIPV